MRKYRVREGSIIDWARYGMAGLVFGLVMGLAIITTYGGAV